MRCPGLSSKKKEKKETGKVYACLGGCGKTRKSKHFTCEKCQQRNSELDKAAKSCKIIFGLPRYDI